MNRIGNILLAAAALLVPVSASAQGVVRFANSGAGLNAPVTNSVTGSRVDGSGYLVQLYGGAAGALEPVLAPLSHQANFFSGGLAGYFDGGVATNTFVLPGSSGTFQLRAWSAGFASYEEAYSAGLVDPNVLVGKSSVFQNSTGISSPGATLTGLMAFSIAPVPEASTAIYFAIGASLVFWRLRS
jgi:hypothetical protein